MKTEQIIDKADTKYQYESKCCGVKVYSTDIPFCPKCHEWCKLIKIEK
ncbi:hypothetical protein LCGC14_0342400 [marine sediment metagenome]|uniref:Uncharacterized protein n=1 Tax=marine sediment metagenome TaxID=412755 RepID=A0A0F9WL20_9ZZZZ